MLRLQMAKNSPNKGMLGKKQIEKLAAGGKRFELMSALLKHVPKGARSVADANKVGPAHIEKCKMAVKKWDRSVKERKDNGQCKGIFFTSFQQTHSFRRCEAVAKAGQEFCDLCKRMRETTRKSGLDFISGKGQPEYEIVKKSVFTRPGVVASMKWWNEKAKEMQEKEKLQKGFPFFSAQEMVSWLLVKGGVVFENGGKGGRPYRRSAVLVAAQDEYLRECMENCMIILRFGTKKKFKNRMEGIIEVADKIGKQMLEANVGGEMSQIGAIQKPDIVREELARAARVMAQTKKEAAAHSRGVNRLAKWAEERARKSQQRASPSATSISSSESSPPKPKATRSGKKQPLRMAKVGTDAKSEKQEPEETDQSKTTEQAVPVFKQFEIKQSTIKEAGRGLFLKEKAENGEEIARYSGKLLTKEQAMKSGSEYIIRVTDNQYLCAEADDEWEGKYINCARKAGKKVNARFQANGKCNFCEVSKKHYLKVYAVGRIMPEEEAWADYNNAYWRNEKGELEQLPTPKSNRVTEEEDNGHSSEWKPEDGEESGTVAAQLLFASSPEASPGKGGGEKEEGPLRRSSRLKKEREERKALEAKVKQEEMPEGDEFEEEGANDNGEEGREDSDDDGKGGVDEEDHDDDDEDDEREDDQQDEGDGGEASDEQEDDNEEEQEQNDENGNKDLMHGFRKVVMKPRKVYAVSVGRCVGIFRSTMRMRSSIFRYPGAYHTKFLSEKEAEEFLRQSGISRPVKYWERTFASGALVQRPQSVTGRDVCFPAGKSWSSEDIKHGVVLGPVFQHDQWMWRVQMDQGQVDCMSEWPLLCGLQMAEVKQERLEIESDLWGDKMPDTRSSGTGIGRSPKNVNKRFKSATVYYAIRGTERDGIVTEIQEVFSRMEGPEAEYEEFSDKEEARRWIDEIRLACAVRFADGNAKMVPAADIKKVTKGKRGIRIVGPTSKRKAQDAIDKWMQEINARNMRKERGSSNQVPVDLVNNLGCIAQMRDGSVCGRDVNVTQTLIGPLCGEHVGMYKKDDARTDENPEKEEKARQKEKESQADLMSPDEGVLMPSTNEALRRDKRGLHSVVAVRTFATRKAKDLVAGSVWLSLDAASASNGKGGEMKIFNNKKDIFENMLAAKEWIEQQVQEESEDAIESEADRRWREVQEKRKSKKKKESSESVASTTNTTTTSSNARSGGTGRGGAGARNASRAGRGRKRKPPKKGKKSESKDDDSDVGDEEEEDGSDDEPATGPSDRFRRSRRKRMGARGGLRSGAMKMLDKRQKRIEEQLFPKDAKQIIIYDFEVPDMKLIQKIPLPGKAQALTTGKDAGHVLSFANDMKAVLAEKTFKSFDAFSLSELMEFHQQVEYVASYQPEENKDVTESVVEGVRVIARNAISLHATMRDSDSLGPYGENFRADTYVQVMYMIMFREVFEGALAEMFFWNYAPKFAVKARGCPGMAPWKDMRLATNATKAKSQDRCLLCGKAGHRADSDVHKAELAEGSLSTSSDQLSGALSNIAKDQGLNAEQKRSWSARVRSFWSKLKTDTQSASL